MKEWLDSGKIGAVKSVRADFGLKATEGWQGWKVSTKYSGGALRDVGIYSVAYAFLGFPNEVPQKIDSVCRLKDGADFHSELLFHYTGNRSAFLSGSFEMVTDHHAVFYGDAGVIVVGPNFWCPRRAELLKYNSEDEFSRERTELFEDDYPSSGMQYEIAHVAECIQNNKKESNLFPLSETLVIAELIDSLRKEWGGTLCF
ncbi:MAG: hypothetical protein LBB68_03405 [Treponema sp.]|nr:hypothetical protein [Treponema sp.]